MPGGVCCAASCEGPPHSQPLWAAVQVAPHCSTETSGTWSGTLHKAAVCCNATAALYWVDSEADSASEQSEGPSAEQTLLEAITVTPTVAQRQHLQQLHLLGPSSSPPSGGEPPSSLLAKAVQALREHGVCILRGFFSPQVSRLLVCHTPGASLVLNFVVLDGRRWWQSGAMPLCRTSSLRARCCSSREVGEEW